MSPDEAYAHGKLREIVGQLATGEAEARHREGAPQQRGLFILTPEDFPPRLRGSFSEIVADLDKREKPGGGYRWTNRTAARIAKRVYNLYRELESCAIESRQASGPRHPASA